jgi:hypothetical protein
MPSSIGAGGRCPYLLALLYHPTRGPLTGDQDPDTIQDPFLFVRGHALIQLCDPY